MFNFFKEIKTSVKNNNFLDKYNLINMSGKIMYVEGHLGLTTISQEIITFKVPKGRVCVEGKNLILHELSDQTLKISGEISKTEVF